LSKNSTFKDSDMGSGF